MNTETDSAFRQVFPGLGLSLLPGGCGRQQGRAFRYFISGEQTFLKALMSVLLKESQLCRGGRGTFPPCNDCVSVIALVWIRAGIQKANRKDGQLSWLKEQFRKQGPIDIPRSFMLQSYPLDSEQSPTTESTAWFEWDRYHVRDLPVS